MTFLAEIFVRNLAVQHDYDGTEHVCEEGEGSEEGRGPARGAIGTRNVAVDDNPEEAVGCGTVGRGRRGRQRDLEDLGRICHRFGRI